MVTVLTDITAKYCRRHDLNMQNLSLDQSYNDIVALDDEDVSMKLFEWCSSLSTQCPNTTLHSKLKLISLFWVFKHFAINSKKKL